jgi:hypothetical protein
VGLVNGKIVESELTEEVLGSGAVKEIFGLALLDQG